MKSSLLGLAVATAVLGLTTSSAFAGGEENPYLPQSNGHSYRHGAVATRELNEKAKAWEHAHSANFAAPISTIQLSLRISAYS